MYINVFLVNSLGDSLPNIYISLVLHVEGVREIIEQSPKLIEGTGSMSVHFLLFLIAKGFP
jgi:hypothetical protein